MIRGELRKTTFSGFHPQYRVSPVVSAKFAPANISLSRSKTQGTYESPLPLPAGGPVLTSCVLASPKEKHRSSFRPSLPPSPTQSLRGHSLFVPDSSRAFLIRPRTMHDEIRTGPPYGRALSIPHCREAHIKTTLSTLSFQNLEAALPPGIPAGEPIQ